MGGSCDGDCTNCDPKEFCHQIRTDLEDKDFEIWKLKLALKIARRTLKRVEEYYGVKPITVWDDGEGYAER